MVLSGRLQGKNLVRCKNNYDRSTSLKFIFHYHFEACTLCSVKQVNKGSVFLTHIKYFLFFVEGRILT